MWTYSGCNHLSQHQQITPTYQNNSNSLQHTVQQTIQPTTTQHVTTLATDAAHTEIVANLGQVTHHSTEVNVYIEASLDASARRLNSILLLHDHKPLSCRAVGGDGAMQTSQMCCVTRCQRYCPSSQLPSVMSMVISRLHTLCRRVMVW